MYRPAAKTAPSGNGGSSPPAKPTSATNSSHQRNASANDDNGVPSTIREIRSRTVGHSTAATSMTARQLLANRRQAMSMERLNGTNSTANSNQNTNSSATQNSASMHNISGLADKEKGSSISGSSNSISGSAASSPSRGSSASSAGTLNRTASRVSRFRSAKAVFERLSSANANANAANRLDKANLPERPRGTVASRYAAAAAARGLAAQQQLQQQANSGNSNATSSPRSRLATGGKSPLRAQDSPIKSSSSSNRSPASVARTAATSGSTISSRPDAHPKPQPRVITTTTRKSPITASHNTTTNSNSSNSAQDSPANGIVIHRGPAAPTSPSKTNQHAGAGSAKPPPRDLIDKIVLEIARDAGKEHGANCTIQDLSNCDTSGIPETLDFDKCFQDVEMMTEEEARKLLSRKSESDVSTLTGHESPLGEDQGDAPRTTSTATHINLRTLSSNSATGTKQRAPEPPNEAENSATSSNLDQSTRSSDSLVPPAPSATSVKYKVRFSDEPVTVFSTHAVEDYDRRNDDIDPVAASAEYEIEKSRERDGLKDDSDEEGNDAEKGDSSQYNAEAVKISEKFTSTFKSAAQDLTPTTTTSLPGTPQQQQSLHEIRTLDHTASRGVPSSQGAPQALRSAAGRDPYDKAPPSISHQEPIRHHFADDDDEAAKKKEYVEFLEHELSLKRILEQNLRDLQSQYYETVKQLDVTKSQSESKIAQLEQSLAELNNRCETNQNELEDSREQAERLGKELADIKESSQLLEKKYHRAKKIIKDMQSRDESFTRREQLYQQKLDEIEYELGVLISTIDKTIYDEGLKYFSITDTSPSCLRQHQTRLDVFGLIRQMLENFSNAQSTQSAQIKQRIVSMLEQQLANLLALSNGVTSISGTATLFPSTVDEVGGTRLKQNNIKFGDSNNVASGLSAQTNDDANNLSNNNSGSNDSSKHSQKNNNNYASHRLSQPNMPHPIGVGGQPTKIFHGLAPLPNPAALTKEPSPPQSVNSYPSSNSLNSLNNNSNININNNNQQLLNNNLLPGPKLRDLANEPNMIPVAPLSIPSHEDHFKPAPNTQTPYQTDEWHEKPVSEWTTHQVSTWLLALGLDQYISKFEDRNVNGQSLINLDSTVLKGLGVLNSNDRNLLKKKIRELRVEMEKERKQNEKKLKENLKGQSSWKKGLLS